MHNITCNDDNAFLRIHRGLSKICDISCLLIESHLKQHEVSGCFVEISHTSLLWEPYYRVNYNAVIICGF